MKKLLSSVLVLFLMLVSGKAFADFDPFNNVPNTLETIQEEIQNGVRYVDNQMTELREMAKYDPRNLVDIEADFIKIPKIPQIKPEVPNFLSDVNNTEKTKEDLEKNVISQITVDTANTTELARKEILDKKSKRMKDFANLYAKAFTIRTNLAREDIEAKKRTSSQSIIKSASTVDNRVVVRLNNIRAMNTALAEFTLSEEVKVFRNDNQEDSEKGDKNAN